MNVQKKILPFIGLISAYVHWVKPRLFSASAASKGGKSLLLHLLARSRFLIPMIVFTAFYLFDAQMQIGVSISLTLSRNVRITLAPDGALPEVDPDDEDEDDGADDDEAYTIDSYSDNSFASDVTIFELDDVEAALQDFIQNGTAQQEFPVGTVQDPSDH